MASQVNEFCFLIIMKTIKGVPSLDDIFSRVGVSIDFVGLLSEKMFGQKCQVAEIKSFVFNFSPEI